MPELYVDPTFPRFTRGELVAEMGARFGDFSDGAFRRYQENGLIADGRHDRRWRRGQHGSQPSLWSENDRRMLAAVLELRERHQREAHGQITMANLANFVVWSWVYWDGYVALPQARRALCTWTKPQLGGCDGGARSRIRMNHLARQRVDALAAPEAPLRHRIRMANEISECLWQDDLDRLRNLASDLETIIDPTGKGRHIGAPGASSDAAGEIERLYCSHRAAKAVVSGHPTVPDDHWEAARQMMRQGWTDYQAEWPRLVATATTPGLFTEPTKSEQVARCSSALLLILGYLLANEPRPGSANMALD